MNTTHTDCASWHNHLAAVVRGEKRLAVAALLKVALVGLALGRGLPPDAALVCVAERVLSHYALRAGGALGRSLLRAVVGWHDLETTAVPLPLVLLLALWHRPNCDAALLPRAGTARRRSSAAALLSAAWLLL